MNKNLTIIFLTVFLYLLGFGIIIPIIPILSKNFGATAFQTGLLMALFSLMQFSFAPVWGRLSDRYGRRPIIIYCLLGEGISYVLFAYADTLTGLFFARALAGIFGASIGTASAYISDISPPQQRTKNMGLIGMAVGLGFVAGPAIGGALAIWARNISDAPHFDTRFSSLWVAAICFGTFLFAFRFLKESLPQAKQESARASRWAQLSKYLSRPVLGPLFIAFGCVGTAMSAMEATLILFVGEKFQWSLKEVSWGFAYIGVIIVITQGFLVRKLIPRLGERTVLKIGLSLFSLGMLAIALSESIYFLAFANTLLALGSGLTNPAMMGSMSLLSDASEQGTVMGLGQSMSALGRILGPLAGGFLYQYLSIYSPYLGSALLGTIALLIVIVVNQKLSNAGRVHEPA